MRIHYLKHVPFEGLAYINEWIDGRSIPTSCTALYQNDPFPRQSDFDCLIIMGGPMRVYDDTNKYPWIVNEKKFIEQSIKENKMIIGICLGAQMIADVLGAKVYPGKNKEIGWFPIKKTGNTSILDSIWPDTFYAFHWHGDTFDIPENAAHILESTACKNQGFIYQDKIFAFQFHLESTKESIEQLISNCGQELEKPDGYIQSADEIREKNEHISKSNQYMDSFLESVIQNK